MVSLYQTRFAQAKCRFHAGRRLGIHQVDAVQVARLGKEIGSRSVEPGQGNASLFAVGLVFLGSRIFGGVGLLGVGTTGFCGLKAVHILGAWGGGQPYKKTSEAPIW